MERGKWKKRKKKQQCLNDEIMQNSHALGSSAFAVYSRLAAARRLGTAVARSRLRAQELGVVLDSALAFEFLLALQCLGRVLVFWEGWAVALSASVNVSVSARGRS